MGIVAIRNGAINNVVILRFHPSNHAAAQKALLSLRGVFIAQFCDEVRTTGKCLLIAKLNNSQPELLLECCAGIRPGAIADPLNISQAMLLINIEKVEFENNSDFSEELVEKVLVSVISRHPAQFLGVTYHKIADASQQVSRRVPCPLTPEEFKDILFQPDTKYQNDVRPMLFKDIIEAHDGQFPVVYMQPLLEKAFYYLRKGQSFRAADLIRVVFNHLLDQDKALFCAFIEQTILQSISSQLPQEDRDHEFADQLWWIFFSLRNNFFHKSQALEIRLRMAREYAGFNDPKSRDIGKVMENWQIMLDLSNVDQNLRQPLIFKFIDMANRFIFDRSQLATRDIETALRLWDMLFANLAINDHVNLLNEFVRNIFKIISLKVQPQDRDYTVLMKLCAYLYAKSSDKPGVIGFVVSLATKRVALELIRENRDVDGAIVCWQTAFTLCPDAESKEKVVQSMMIRAKALVKEQSFNELDVIDVLKIWAAALQMDVSVVVHYDLIMMINNCVQRFAVLRKCLAKSLHDNYDFYPGGKFYSSYILKIKAIAYLHRNMHQELDEMIAVRNDMFIASLKLEALMDKGRTIDARNHANKLLDLFATIKDPDIFQVAACIRAYCTRGEAYIHLAQNKADLLDLAEKDFESAIRLAHHSMLGTPPRAQDGLNQVQALRRL